MELKIMSLDGEAAGSVDLPDAIFGLVPRKDILHRCVRWQLAKRQRGTHKTKDRSEIWRTGKKMYAQKGTGQARHSSARVNLFRGGGRSFGPVVRSHATDLPKQLRSLALKHALSSKAKSSDLIIIDEAKLGQPKTKALIKNFEKLGLTTALIIDGAEVEKNFGLAARNLPGVDVLPVAGINVYDIMRRNKLVLTKAAVEALEARLK
jgi:large subunit ribosomal protein L4